MTAKKNIFVAGHNGMVGSAIVRQLQKQGDVNVITRSLCASYNRQYARDYRSVMPTNLYGPNDNVHPQNSHVIPALLRRFHEAKERGDATVTPGAAAPRYVSFCRLTTWRLPVCS